MNTAAALRLASSLSSTARFDSPKVSTVDGVTYANILLARPDRSAREAFVAANPGSTFSITTCSCLLSIPVLA